MICLLIEDIPVGIGQGFATELTLLCSEVTLVESQDFDQSVYLSYCNLHKTDLVSCLHLEDWKEAQLLINKLFPAIGVLWV